MVLFDRLQVSDSGRMLYMDVHVNKASYFDNIYIDKVIIQTQEQVSEADPLSPGDEYIYKLEVEPNTKELHLALNASTDFDVVCKTLSDKLLFVYVICKGVHDECTPCRLVEMTTLGVTFDEALLYQHVMQYTSQLVDTCDIPKEFIDFILLWNGFKAAVETEHYLTAIDFWKKLFDRNYGAYIGKSKPCGCHG
jgi:hypothetical protein